MVATPLSSTTFVHAVVDVLPAYKVDTTLPFMKLGELAKQAGVNVQMIRFYERHGLVPEPKRDLNGYRLCGLEVVRASYAPRVVPSIGSWTHCGFGST
jgi:hypothetical protein